MRLLGEIEEKCFVVKKEDGILGFSKLKERDRQDSVKGLGVWFVVFWECGGSRGAATGGGAEQLG